MPIIKGFDNDSSLSETLAGESIVIPTRAIQGVEYQAHFRDPEGNVIGIMENDPSAR